MMLTAVAHRRFIDRLWPQTQHSLARQATLVVLGTALLWASAKTQLPMWPVPMTMQSFVVLVLGMAYGPRLAVATIGAYLLEGAFGLPVFAGTPEKGIGLAYMVGPTGGYLLGFVLAGLLVGWLAECGWDRTLSASVGAMTIGTVVLFAPGVAWLATTVGWENAIGLGLTPFLVGSVIKLALAAAVVPLAWRALTIHR
jgi:biotin transport system substrate-specific component